jgi:NAD+ kinase
MNYLVVCRDENQVKELQNIISLPKETVVYRWKNTLKKEEVKKTDIIIAVGGDGTVLSASHFITTQPLLAVNSDPHRSVGALTTCTVKDLSKKIKKIRAGDYKTETLERIDVRVNGKIIEPTALNEVFIASEKAYLMSKYNIRHKSIEEVQRSSGIIIATGTGSTAWFKSAGGNPFPKNAPYIKSVTREPYEGYKGKNWKYIITKITIHRGNNLIIQPAIHMILAIDSIREVRLAEKDTIELSIAKNPLKLIT